MSKRANEFDILNTFQNPNKTNPLNSPKLSLTVFQFCTVLKEFRPFSYVKHFNHKN